MTSVQVLNNNKGLVLDSREVAEMLGKEHYELLKEIEGRKDGKNAGILPTLEKGNFHVSDFFIESSYKSEGNNKSYKCYLITKKGCEVLGHKQQGEKGILFTVKYVDRFNEMEQQLQNKVDSYLIQDPIQRAKAWIKEQEEKVLLIDKIKEDEPLVALAKKRLDKNGIASITDATKSFNLKRGRITRWAKNNGYIHKTIKEVNNKGDKYFKVYDNGGFKNVGITEQGLQLINDNLDYIK